jgi:hypothetical protein
MVANREGRAALRWLRQWERPPGWLPPTLLLLLLRLFPLFLGPECAKAQDNYDIQVYGSQTVAPKSTMVELLSNLTADGTKPLIGTVYPEGPLYPTDDALHESVEIRQGITSWSEAGFYIFTSASSGHGWQWVGDRLRAQVRAPDSWRWPVGVSVSLEFGYQRPPFSKDTWTMELRPIIDKRLGRWYFAVNPSLERSFQGQSVSQGVSFAPSVKFSYAFNKSVSGGLEYYGDYGSLLNISSFHNQQQQFFPTIDLNVSPEWELNVGVGIGVTTSTDDWIWKVNISRRFDWTHPRAESPARTQ